MEWHVEQARKCLGCPVTGRGLGWGGLVSGGRPVVGSMDVQRSVVELGPVACVGVMACRYGAGLAGGSGSGVATKGTSDDTVRVGTRG